MKKNLILFVVCVLVMLIATKCTPPQSCPDNPPLNTVLTAHGNTDWHIDTAEEFLFGTDMAGTNSAANHCPATWTRTHMHVDLSNTAHFYYDSDLVTPGDDTDTTSGIDQAMLFFYAGHGNPTLWNTLGNSATQVDVSLGDCPGSGLLRYYWQCSCEVFAHGPRTCTPATHNYACPGDFDGSADSVNMRNVYERWGPALNPDLRMACGSSTSAYCHETETNKIWDNYNNKSYDVADSFIDGLHRISWVTPLCITLGGGDVTNTPLYDTVFTNQPNTSGTSHYHIQYLETFASTPSEMELLSADIPELLPILEVEPLPLPETLRSVEFTSEGELMLSSNEIGDRGAQVRVNSLSGSVYILGERVSATEGDILEEEEYVEFALRFIEEQGWSERNLSEPTGIRFVVATMPVTGEQDASQSFQKNVIVTFKRQIDIDGMLISVLGEGGAIAVQMNNDGSVLNASKVWRDIVSADERVPVKTYEEAYEEALDQIENPQAYELDQFTWGYKEAAGNVEQTELRIVFSFWFVPVDSDTLLEYPPRMIEILGQPQ